jgi:hypothetical protein
MKFFRRNAKPITFSSPETSRKINLGYLSTSALERGLDGSDKSFEEYFFALYHCSPDEPAEINDRRQQLRDQYPSKAIQVGRHFVLSGEAAFQALAAYYQGYVLCETLSDDFRAFSQRRLDAMIEAHRKSQSLPVPIDLTEGQLSEDRELGFLTCIAISNGQVVERK